MKLRSREVPRDVHAVAATKSVVVGGALRIDSDEGDSSGRTPMFQSFKTRNFRLFFSGQIVSQVGNWLTLVAQTLLVLHLTNSGVAVGLLTAFQFAPVLVLGPWAGAVADRVDKRKLLLIVQSIAMMQSGALAALAFSGRPPVVAI